MTETTNRDSDRLLVERLKRREPGALDALLEAHGAKMYGVAMQFTHDENDAQEVLQDALITIWKKIESFEGRSAFPTWLHRVTANAALLLLRRRRRFQYEVPLDASAADPSAPQPTAARVLLTGELDRIVRAAIDQLPEAYRHIVLLRDIEEFSLDEIAEATGLTLPAVKSRLHRGRLALRERLLPYLKDGRVKPT
jgi:RNA polymerase sigma-70 factor (ECF subfamily)